MKRWSTVVAIEILAHTKKTCLFLFVGTSGFCISNLFTTQLVQTNCIQNIQFSISIRRSPKTFGLLNKIFEMNKIEQMNCHVLSKQVLFKQCFVSALWKKCVAKSDRWQNEFGVLRPFQQYFSHIGTMEGRTWKALCNKVPSSFGENLSSSWIRTRESVIRSWDR